MNRRFAMLFAPLALIAAAAPASDPSLSPQDILRQADLAYHFAGTYVDTGVVRTVYYSERGPRTVEKPFQTVFVRPNQFRFEIRNRRGEYEFDRYVVQWDGTDLNVAWTVNPEMANAMTTLNKAMSGAAGISNKASFFVPIMLLPGLTLGEPVTAIRNAQRLDDEAVDGDPCFRLQGMRRIGDVTATLWIDQETFLVRKVYEEKAFDDFRTETTWIYEPAIDVEVDPAQLAFSPPDRGW